MRLAKTGLAGLGAAAALAFGTATALAWSGPPQVTPLCQPTPNLSAWSVAFTETEANYNIDFSAGGDAGWTEVTSSSVPFTFYTPSSDSSIYVRWDSDHSKVTGPLAADQNACPTPTPSPTPTPTPTSTPTPTPTATPSPTATATPSAAPVPSTGGGDPPAPGTPWPLLGVITVAAGASVLGVRKALSSA